MIRRKRQAFLLPLLLMIAVPLAACGDNGPDGLVPVASVPEGTGPNGRSVAGFSPEAGQLVRDFTVSTGAGSSFTLRGHRGEIILLYFSFPG